ncbi:hypothetical protein GT204_06880 [Streptomyces sp. SID4919]|uniref:hypothetical protein n=1 Tax=unclassified Streptomyces TaxID=2593676 RepID=UPI000823E0C9|nr:MULTISPECIES: hypothetical protein [unclassified Streptomyces]MYY08635.1 hypothetical protein [Streptomyces sp. SID4919]SCK55563.1 hypothetical protein YW7DRAFT_05140 [Streptomyces sp. AmelKG-E11A]
MVQHLGPLELVGNRWVIGDPERNEGSCLVLAAEGIEHHMRGEAGPRDVVPWNSLHSVQLRATMKPWMASRTGGVIVAAGGGCMDGGRDSCSLSGIRDRYRPWSVNYTHHERAYTSMHMALVIALVGMTSTAKALHRLGDPEWLSAVVSRLAPTPRWTPLPVRRVSEIIELLGP